MTGMRGLLFGAGKQLQRLLILTSSVCVCDREAQVMCRTAVG